MSPARIAAFDVLRAVEGGGFASDLLRSRTASLEERDAALAHKIVLGSLRFQAQLDYAVQHISGRPVSRFDSEVRIALRMGTYQIRHLERVPRHAAVFESVEAVKRAGKRSAASLVNAVLRKLEPGPLVWPDLATKLSMPVWLLDRWEAEFGGQMAETIASAMLEPPETPENPVTGLRQDVGAQVIVPLLGIRPGHSFLDLCAAPGNKTAQAVALGARAVACDRHWKRLKALDRMFCDRVVLDGTVSLPFHARFDRILVDVPCSGTGTLARNPEIKWRLQPSKLVELHAIQVKMLRNALAALAPGGRLVYSTCSLEREENEEVVAEVTGAPPARTLKRLPGRDAGDGFFAAVIPSE